eukprot:TRINITY_DN1694_c0_g1_i1.p1 TRINITY_DN1694_c0_g1~~TRINITY_DN1694_c0_g1_i1.p1  ORF type:complete len:350 (-),score=102.93 TRINITY_DN1694_c0_g1_i1:60-1109(-)
MPGRKRAAPKKGKEEVVEKKEAVVEEPVEEKTKKQKIGIDMTKIPSCLLEEGFDLDQKSEEKAIPEFLNCPICKEILVEPEMYGCGHTVCKLCISGPMARYSHTRECPVCKVSCYQSTIPNYVVKQMLESQYAKETKVRIEKLKEIQDLAIKVAQYGRSARFTLIDSHFEKFMEEKRFIHSDALTKHFIGFRDIKPSLSEDEFRYFLALKLQVGYPDYKDLGSHIVKGKSGDVEYHLSWLQQHKKRKEIMIWMPLIMMNASRSLNLDQIKRFAEVYNIPIGETLTIEQWKSKPAYWLKTIDLGEIRGLPGCAEHSCGFHGTHVFDSSDSDDSNDGMSDSDDDNHYLYDF